MNVPKLRFKEFTDDWDFIELSKISSDISYGMGLPSKEYDGKNKYIRITDIDDSTNVYSNKDIVSPDGKLEDKYLVNNNDILFARTGASTGKTYLYNEKDGKLYFAGFLIRANIINHNSIFIFQQTKLNKYSKWVKIMSMRSGQPGINSQEYGAYKFSVTSKIEEDKIANFLSLLDKKIELQTKKIEDLKLYKLSLLKHLLKKYDTKKIILKDICKIYAGGTPSTSNEKYWNGNIKWIQSGLIQNCLIKRDDIKNTITELGVNKSSTKLIKPNTTLLAMTGATCGNTAFLECEACANQSVMAFETTKVNSKFIYYLFQNNKKYILKFQAGGAQSGINKNSCENLEFDFPNIEIQNKIVKLLDCYENQLNFSKLKLNKLQKLKKGLMQSMFI